MNKTELNYLPNDFKLVVWHLTHYMSITNCMLFVLKKTCTRYPKFSILFESKVERGHLLISLNYISPGST